MATTLSTGIILPDNNDYVTRANERSNLQTISDKIIEGENTLTTHLAESATTSAKGHVQLATSAEVTTGTNNTKAVTPASAKVELDKKAPLRFSPHVDISSNTTLNTTHANKRLVCHTNAVTITIPSTTAQFSPGDEIEILNWSGLGVTITPDAGVILNSKDAKRNIPAQFTSAVLLMLSDNTWILIGALE